MPITEIYSKRLKSALGDLPDLYTYDSIPQELRIQVTYLWAELTSISQHSSWPLSKNSKKQMYQQVSQTLAREYGRLQLVENQHYNHYNLHCYAFLLNCSTEQALDIIELSFQVLLEMSSSVGHQYSWRNQVRTAIEELNHRFREHGVGYQFVDGFIVKVDSQFVHQEIVRPALRLLHEAGFEGASEEFLAAHEHYRHGRNKEAVNEALKSYESTMKTICDQQDWEYSDSASASKLVTIVVDNGLVPTYLLDHMSGLRSALDSGLITIRNKGAAHGQGAQTVEAPDSVAAFALHLAASNIVFLVERHKELLAAR